MNEQNCNTVDLTDPLIKEMLYDIDVVRDLTIDDLIVKIRNFFGLSKTVLFEQVDE